jgi:hypothetical protein
MIATSKHPAHYVVNLSSLSTTVLTQPLITDQYRCPYLAPLSATTPLHSYFSQGR